MVFAIGRPERREGDIEQAAAPGVASHDPELQARVLDDFFSRLGRASERVLMLDYDGTLAPFRVERDEAQPYPGVLEAVQRIMRDERSRIVIMTGRRIADFRAVSGFPAGLEIWGSHGWEHQRPDGAYAVMAGSDRGIAGLVRARAWLGEKGLSGRTEFKPGCLEFHWRGLAGEQIGEMRELLQEEWPKVANGSGAIVEEFDGGMSLRMPGRNKGTAARAVLSRLPADAVAACLGDDATDEYALGALAAPHLGILVRDEYRATLARAWLRPPEEVLGFFERWIEPGKDAHSI